jgi:catechol 2,3-dioxygenase-like lactoylglutathione lyase family enzyme
MKQTLGLVSLVVREYDEAIAFYVGILGFTLVEDRFIPEQNKRWVVLQPRSLQANGDGSVDRPQLNGGRLGVRER